MQILINTFNRSSIRVPVRLFSLPGLKMVVVVVNKDSDEDTQQNQVKMVVVEAVGDSTKK